MFKAVLSAMMLSATLTASSGAGADVRADSLFGTLGYIFTEARGGEEVDWTMAVNGRTVHLEMPSTIVQSAGGFTGLAGRRVSVSGRAFGETIIVQKIGWSLTQGASQSPMEEGPIRNSLTAARSQVFILAKFRDVTTVPHAKAWYETLTSGAAPSLRDYFLEQSYGAWDIAGSVVVGWVTLPKTKAQYATTGGNGIGVDDEAVVKDALAAADPQVDYRQFDGFHVLLNDAVGNIGGTGGRGTYTLDGQTRLWGRTYGNNGSGMLGLLAHEMGHSFGFDHSSGPYKTPYDSHWDQMSATGVWERRHPEYGPYPQHTNSYHRIVTGLTPRNLITECLPGFSQIVHLTRPVQPLLNGPQAARIFLGGDGQHWLTVEARRRIGTYEQGVTLPDEGVVLHDCNPAHQMVDIFSGVLGPGPVSQVVDIDNNGDPNDAASVWKPGETYTDPTNGVTVAVLKATATGYDVQVNVSSIQPSPALVTNHNDSGPGSLRGAITFANLFPGTTIKFGAPSSALTNGELVIRPITPLPDITAATTTIDGTTQTALADSNPGMPEVAIDGSNLTGWGNGLTLTADRDSVKGIAVRSMPTAGIYLSGATLAALTGCATGLDRTGTVTAGNGWAGVAGDSGSNDLKVTDLLASGNAYNGLIVRNSTGLTVLGGKFGTDRTGASAVGNVYDGMYLENVKTVAVSPSAVSVPLFSGSAKQGGMVIRGCSNVKLTGIRVGTDPTGNLAVPNFSQGAWMENCAQVTLKSCQFSGNKGDGIVFVSDNATATTITDCLFGTDASGTNAIGNEGGGVWVDAPGIKLTGCTASGNAYNGIVLYHRATGAVKNCKLGTDKSGSVALPNGYKGIAVDQAQGWSVSGCTLSGNAQEGIATYNGAGPGTIENCKIGLGNHSEKLGSPWGGAWIGDNSHDIKLTGNQVANNGGGGIDVGLSAKVAITGGKVTDCGNSGVVFFGGANAGSLTGTEIRGCKNQGVGIGDATTHDITVSGVLSDGNEWGGIAIYAGAYGCKVDSNTLLNYTGCGISIQGGAHDNVVVGNVVGCLAKTPTVAANTGWGGIGLWGGATNNIIGTIGAGNLVGPGTQIGVYVNDATTVGNAIRGDSFTGTTGLAIDLGGDWKDTNDANDADPGPNRKQNYPVLTKGTTTGSIKITYQGAASRTIYVDLYAVDPKRDAGSGPGFTYLGTITVTTSASGAANKTFTVPAGTTRITATATDKATGDTSEFCPNLLVS
ncbi:hypothetical protein BH11ARM2_BH11ARM2_33320 [soil metagenome]